MPCQHIFTTKTLYTVFAKIFLICMLCFVKHKSVKIFDVHIMRFIFISYEQQIHWIFKFLILDMNGKSQLIFITIHINANILFRFNLAKIFFSHRKSNSIIIKIIIKFFIFLCNSFWMYFCSIYMINMTP